MLHLKTGEKTYVTTPFVWITKLKKKNLSAIVSCQMASYLSFYFGHQNLLFGYQLCPFCTKFFLSLPVRPTSLCSSHAGFLSVPERYLEYSCLWVFALVISAGNFFQWKLCWQIPPHSSGIFTNVAVYIRTSSTSLFSNFSLPQNSLPFLLL